MPSKISWFSKEIILQIGRSTGWISLVYILGLVFALPLRILMIYSDEKNRTNLNVGGNLFRFDFTIQVVLFITVPILLSVFLFRYLHVKQATDLVHSLPLKRNKLYHHYALSGVFFLVLPIVLITVSVLIIYASLHLQTYFGVRDIFYWAGTAILATVCLYTAGIFIAMMTGISAVHAVLTYIFLIFPVGITLLVVYNLKILLYGFPSDYYLRGNLDKMSPLTEVIGLEGKPFDWSNVLVFSILTILLYGLSLIFYKKRNLEAASEPIAFVKLRSIFKYGVTFCTMLLGGAYFSETLYNLGWSIFGYVAGAVMGYFVAEMVLQKTWRVFRHIKGLVIYTVIMILFAIGFQTLGIYENHIPKQDEIKSVLLTDNPSNEVIQDHFYKNYYAPKPIREQDNIKSVLKLHEQILADKQINQKNKSTPYKMAFFVYELKNGQKVIREYQLNQKLYDDFYKPIYESTEYKEKTEGIFRVRDKDVETIAIGNYGPVGKRAIIPEPSEIKTILAMLKKDVLARTYEDGVYFKGGSETVEINLGKNNQLSLELLPTYTNTRGWLKEKGFLERATITENDINYILVHRNNNPNGKTIIDENQPGNLKITDKEHIREALANAGPNPGSYEAIFYFEQGNTQQAFFFDEDHAPDFIRDHFKK
ncbi:MAG: DUF6449 domain-containing protein [Bacillota bacterium]|nr:DUF6449 domain-containing protein [Bacillota bacterium]